MRISILSNFIFAMAAFGVPSPETHEFEIMGLEKVSLENQSGKVKISAYAGPKAIVVSQKNKFSDKCQMTLKKDDEELVIKVKKHRDASWGEDCDVDFEVKVPKAMNLDLEAGSGDFSISGIHGALDFKLGSGSLSADGSFRKVDGKTGSGEISVKGLTGGGELRTGSGDIKLTFAKSPKNDEVELKTGSGNATVLVPHGSQVRTSFTSGNGQLNNEIGEGPKEQSFLVSMEAGSGGLTIKSY